MDNNQTINNAQIETPEKWLTWNKCVQLVIAIMVLAIVLAGGGFRAGLINPSNTPSSILGGFSVFSYFFLLFGGTGIILSLLALIPPIRGLALDSLKTRLTIIFSIGLLTFSMVFPSYTWAEIYFEHVVLNRIDALGRYDGIDDFLEDQEVEFYNENISSLVHELRIRAMIPPPMRQPCYITEISICQVADKALGHVLSWKRYMLRVMASSWSIIIGSVLVWYYTRKESPKFFKALLISIIGFVFSNLILLIIIFVVAR